MNDDLDDWKAAYSGKNRERIFLASTGAMMVNAPVGGGNVFNTSVDPYAGVTVLGGKSSMSSYMASTGAMMANASVGGGNVFNTSVDQYSAIRVLGGKPSISSYMASTGAMMVNRLGGASDIFNTSVDQYSAIKVLGGKSSVDPYPPGTGTIMGNMFGSASDIFSSSVDPYHGSIGLRLKTSGDSYLAPTGTIISTGLGAAGLGLSSTGLGIVTTDFSHSNQNILGFGQQSAANLASFASRLAIVPARKYQDISPLGSSSENLYGCVSHDNKRIRFEVKITLEFNDGRDVPDDVLEEQKRELLELFGGVSWDLQARGGAWKDGGKEYRNTHLNLIVDAPATEHSRRTMLQFKERCRQRLGQVELYMTNSIVEIM